MGSLSMPIALEGDLAHFYPSEVLQLLQLAQAAGRLELTRGAERVDLWYERGRPVFARTSGVAVRAGELLMHKGAVSAQALGRALERQKAAPGRRVGQLLVEQGDASNAQVTDAVQEVLRRIVYNVILWRDGRFRFLPGEVAEGEDITLDLDLDRLILEGLRLADQERAVRSGETPA
jgi:glycine/D-amino acid oxidase-like deaminating enzyme